MAVLPVYNSFHPVMKKSTEEIENIDNEVKSLVDNMFETMYHAEGIGLAANQVGVSKSVIVIDISQNEDYRNQSPIVMINPKILSSTEDEVSFLEGCLSVPGFYEKVDRPERIQIQYYDLNMKEVNTEADEYLSRVMQHEIDHLNGILFYERLTPLRRSLAKNKLKKIKKGNVSLHYDMVSSDDKLIKPNNKISV